MNKNDPLDAKLAKNLLMGRTCDSCEYNDDWNHPHNGDLVKSCKIHGPRRDNICGKWKASSKAYL